MRHFFWLFILAVGVANAQQQDSAATLYLNEVTVYGMPVNKYSAGSKVETISTNSTSFLQQDLSSSSSIYFKNYGNDQLSTIAFRGTSSSHTAVLWNGMNISSPTLGQTDFALLPSFLLEDVALQYGTASSLYGSDALGGSVILNQRKPTFAPAKQIYAQQQAGSFGRYFSGLKLYLSNKNWEIRTKVMERWLENNFSYSAPAVGYRKTQNNAGVKTYGIDQQVHYKIADNKWISFEGLYTVNHREIQPNVTNENSSETLRDKNARFSLSYQGAHAMGHVFTSLGFIANDELYNRSSDTKSNQYTYIVNINREIGSSTSIRYGGNASVYTAKSDGYKGTQQEGRYDLFASVTRQFFQLWNVSLNVRQSFYAGRYAPFSPSIGTQYYVVKTNHRAISISSQISRGYRVPTLNDRYWTPGGNPSIKSEDARHIEGGITWRESNKNTLKLSITSYRTLVDQWILWTPNEKGIWTPMNLQKVNAYGLEGAASYEIGTQWSKWEFGINYSYTRSKNLKSQNDTDQSTIGKQLPYVPLHQGNIYEKFSTGKWLAEVRFNYTGYRYTTLSNTSYQFLKTYYLLNLQTGRVFETKKISFTAQAQVNNILDLYYETYENHAMPGRNYNLNLIINFKSN